MKRVPKINQHVIFPPAASQRSAAVRKKVVTSRTAGRKFRRGPASVAAHASDLPAARTPTKGSIESAHLRKIGFYRFVDTRIQRLRTDVGDEVDPHYWARLRRFFAQFANDDSLFPALADDGDGGVFAEWRSAGWRLEVGIEADGVAYACASGPDGAEIFSIEYTSPDEADSTSSRALRNLLRHMTRLANDSNPDWKRLYVAR